MSAAPSARPATLRRPVTVTVVVALQVVASVIALISAFDLIGDAFAVAGSPAASQAVADVVSAADTRIGPGIVAQAVFLAGVWLLALTVLRLLAVVALARGRRTARPVLGVLVVTSLVGGLSFLFQGFVLRAALLVVVDVAVLWLLYDQRTTAFLRAAAGNAVDSEVVER